ITTNRAGLSTDGSSTLGNTKSANTLRTHDNARGRCHGLLLPEKRKKPMLYNGEWNRGELDYQALVNQWHVVALSEDLDANKPRAVRLLGEDLVLWRDESGGVHAWKDYCGHRGARLSLGCRATWDRPAPAWTADP